MPSGFLCLDKPAGRSSRDITTAVHKKFKPLKAGHVGTLDPLATGVLVIGIGGATRLSNRLHELPKEYVGRFRIGFQSNTEDVTGHVESFEGPEVTRADLESVLDQFTGVIEQTPPAFSAVKVGGRRAYDIARSGQSVALTPKTVEVHDLEILNTPEDGTVKEFDLRIACSSGTYVRSLGRDIARAVGTSAIMSQLRRTRLGPFDESMAIAHEDVSSETQLVNCLIAVGDLDHIQLSDAQVTSVRHGNALQIEPPTAAASFAFLTPAGDLLAVAEPTHLGLQPRVVLKDVLD